MPPKGQKTSTFDPAVPPFDGQASFSLPVPSGPDSPFSGESTPTGTTSSTKRQRSDTSASYLAGFDSWRGDARDYWLHRWKLLTPKEGKPPGHNQLSVIFCTMLGDMQEDYTQKVDSLVALLTTEREARLATEDALLQLQSRLTTAEGVISAALATIPQPPPPPPATGSTPGATQQPLPPPAFHTQGPSWAQVTRRARKPTTQPGKTPPATAPAPTKEPSPPNRAITQRERRLIIKRDGSPLPTSVIAIRDSVNSALQATLIQRVVCRPTNDLTLITMETVKASSLSSKVSQFLHLIPGTTTVQLDNPTTQLLVHGIPTSHTLADIGRELTTYNSGLALALPPRWLTPDDRRASKAASAVVITVTGPKAQEFASASRLSAFSTTFKLERHLRFNQFTQCANCQQFGHHTLKCPNAPSCRWCASPHPTRDHSCPSSTCQ